MLTMAGHKGYGIALLIETMAGHPPGAGLLDEAKSWILNPMAEGFLGQTFIVINPRLMVPIDDFKLRVDLMIRKLACCPKQKTRPASTCQERLNGSAEKMRSQREFPCLHMCSLPFMMQPGISA
jgi:LDH2 family malate/lactate/ureidoglycolate dehydrogenase